MTTDPFSDFPLPVARRLDTLCRRFEKAWTGPSPPRIEDYLGDVTGPERRALLRELLLLEVDCLTSRGERPEAGAYLDRFPDDRELIRLIWQDLTSIGQGSDTAPPLAMIPELLGLRLSRVLGRGGMGVVYQGEQPALRRTVAVKMIGRLDGWEEARKRFRVEAEAIARLQHPHVVQIFEVGEHDGSPYLVLEYLEAGSLADRIRAGGMTPTEAARLVATLARAVHHAHGQGIIHRDLKPGNVLFTRDGVPKVTDFGLARATGTSTPLTRTEHVVGTPAYMAPEQTGDDHGAIGPATDVYALGVILYECLTGRPPFRGSTPMEVVMALRTTDPTPLRKLQPGVPRDLETICLKCLRKEPGKRYLDAEALADDLDRFLQHLPIRARPVSTAERALKWMRRHPAWPASVLTALLAVAVTAGWLLSRTPETEPEKPPPQQPAEYFHLLAQAEKAFGLGQLDEANGLLDACAPELRDWEWHFLRGKYRSSDHALDGHEGTVRSVSFSSDGHLLASASDDGTIRLWDTGAWQPARTLDGHDGPVRQAVFHPQGKALVSGGEDGAVTFWDLGTGKGSAVGRHEGVVTSLAFHPQGKLVASVGLDGMVRTWDGASGEAAFTLPLEKKGPPSVAFHPGGGFLATADGSIETVWDIKTRKPVFRSGDRLGQTTGLAFDPTGGTLVSAWQGGYLLMREAAGRQLQGSLEASEPPLAGFGFSADGVLLATLGNDRAVRLWAYRGQGEKRKPHLLDLRGPRGTPHGLAISPDGRHVAAAFDRAVHVWDIGPGRRPVARLHTGHPTSPLALAFTPDGAQILTPVGFPRIGRWDTATGAALSAFEGQAQPVYSLAVSPDGRYLAAGGGPSVQVWETASRRLLHTFPGTPKTPFRPVTFSPDSARFAHVGDGPRVTVRSLPSGEATLTLDGPGPILRWLAFGTGGERLVVVGVNGAMRAWDARTGQEAWSVPAQEHVVRGAAMSGDGERIATCGEDHAIQLWDVRTGERRATWRGLPESVWAVCFSPDGRRVASGSVSGVVQVWDVASGTVVLTLEGQTGPLVWSPDGRRLAGGEPGTGVLLWDAPGYQPRGRGEAEVER